MAVDPHLFAYYQNRYKIWNIIATLNNTGIKAFGLVACNRQTVSRSARFILLDISIMMTLERKPQKPD